MIRTVHVTPQFIHRLFLSYLSSAEVIVTFWPALVRHYRHYNYQHYHCASERFKGSMGLQL